MDAGCGYAHSERDEKERDKKIAQRGHLGDDVQSVGEGGDGDPRDQSAHLAREIKITGEPGNEETPGQGADLNQLRQPRDMFEKRREGVAAGGKRHCHQDQDFAERQRQWSGGRMIEVGLDGEKEDGEQILHHQNAKRQPSLQGVEFAFVVEQFDDNHRAAQRGGRAQIQRVESAGPKRKADEPEAARGEDDSSQNL